MNLIEAEALSKRFSGTEAVHQLHLAVPEGCIYSLVGPNGAGKSTTIKMLLNIHRPTSGRAAVLGVDTRGLGPPEFEQIGYVSENQEMPDWMTVRYFLDYWKHFYTNWDAALAGSMVRQFELPLDRKLRHLSRGMRMKAALASSLAYRPRLLILDEPFGGLDALVRDELIESILDRASETTILISSHDLAEIESFASHVGYLHAGRLEFSEEFQTLSARFREVEVTLDAPPTRPGQFPSSWMDLASSASVVRFVESQFHPERTPAAVRERFPSVQNIEIQPMALRKIFVSLARQSRRTA